MNLNSVLEFREKIPRKIAEHPCNSEGLDSPTRQRVVFIAFTFDSRCNLSVLKTVPSLFYLLMLGFIAP